MTVFPVLPLLAIHVVLLKATSVSLCQFQGSHPVFITRTNQHALQLLSGRHSRVITHVPSPNLLLSLSPPLRMQAPLPFQVPG